MIKVYNKQTSFIIIGDKYIAPFKSEVFNERNAIIRSLERNGIVRVTEVTPENINPVTPDLFDYEIKKDTETESVASVAEEPETIEEVVETNDIVAEEPTEENINEETELVAEEPVEEEQPKKKRRNSKKKGE